MGIIERIRSIFYYEDYSSCSAAVKHEGEQGLPLEKYENRRPEILESTEPVEGIFYLHGSVVVPDYYSECLRSDIRNPLRQEMYCKTFHTNYMLRKYDDIGYYWKSTPRGRVKFSVIMIDKCYSDNEEIINQIREIYRLPGDSRVITSPQHRCPYCYGLPD